MTSRKPTVDVYMAQIPAGIEHNGWPADRAHYRQEQWAGERAPLAMFQWSRRGYTVRVLFGAELAKNGNRSVDEHAAQWAASEPWTEETHGRVLEEL